MGGYTPTQLAMYTVLILGLIALIYVGAGAMGIAIPSSLVQFLIAVVVICFVVFILILAIKFIGRVSQ